MKTFALLLPFVFCALGAGPGSAQVPPAGPQALRVRSLAANCAHCHGTDGRALADAAVPGLAGKPAAVLIERLTEFKSGARAGTLMPQIAKGYSDAQIQQLAAYFSAQTP
jgi:cytochrome subunit of sulfide dehydrogenase